MVMNAQSSENLPLLESHRRWSLHYLTGHDLEWYAKILSRPILYLAVLNITFHLVGGFPGLEQTFNDVFLPLLFFVEIATYIWVGLLVTRATAKKNLSQGMQWMSGVAAGAFTGIAVAIFMALFKIFWYREFWTIINIVTEPAIRLLEGLFISGLASGISLGLKKINNHH